MRRAALLLVTALVLASCKSNSSNETTSYAVQIVSTPPASAPTGTVVPLSVRVTKSVNNGASSPASGISATLTVTAGGGSIDQSTVTTASDGTATRCWRSR